MLLFKFSSPDNLFEGVVRAMTFDQAFDEVLRELHERRKSQFDFYLVTRFKVTRLEDRNTAGVLVEGLSRNFEVS